jgi:hypothetical protein
MPDGRKIDGIAGLQSALLAQEDRFLGNLARQVATYALGRELGAVDQAAANQWVGSLKAKGRTFRNLIHSITHSEAFRCN